MTGVAGTGPDWDGLGRGLSGQVVLPGSADYEQARPPFVAGFDALQPQAVVRCGVPRDVAQALAFARRHDLPVAVRSGGHCRAGLSSTHGMVIDVTPMRSVAVAGGVASVGAGVRLGELYERLAGHGLTVPAGTCPSVGIGGLTLGGGHGILGRAYGLTLDHLVQAQVVLADGRVTDCDEHHHGDLFWALRGAGAGSFGVVTSLTFQTRPAPASMANFRLAWPYHNAAAVIAAWQQWAPSGPGELAADLALTAAGDLDAEPAVEVFGAVLGSRHEADALLDDLTAMAGSDPLSRACAELSWRDTVRHQAAPEDADGHAVPAPHGQLSRQRHRFSKSEFFDGPLPGQAIAALAGNLASGRVPGQDRVVQFAPWGGAYNRPPPQATAFAHRSQRFLLEHETFTSPRAPTTARHAAQQWVTRSWATVHPWGSRRVYPNFPDPGLQDPARAYYRDNYPRLRQIKASYDPGAVFGSLHGTPAGDTAIRPGGPGRRSPIPDHCPSCPEDTGNA